VLLDDAPVCSCLIPLAQVRGARVTTIEGLGGDHPLQQAFAREGGAQCGICTPGMIMAALALPANPSLDQVRRALAGNLCRCTGYEAIYRAVAAGLGTRDSGFATAPPGELSARTETTNPE
jgi:aerobic-type carbon monoxide dehydrogenase small subunit (CoxS/CutS family)